MESELLAQIVNPALPSTLGNNPGKAGNTIGMLIGNIVGGIVIIAFLMTFMYLLMGGISWISSGGDKAQLESSRNKITHAIIGLVIVAAAWAIMNIVGPFLGINFPNLPIPTINGTTP
jgi:hypothetical protein